MLRFVFRERRLTVDGIFATVAAYLVIALLFAQVYLLLLAWNPESFALPVAAAERAPHLLQNDMTYFSLVTLATVGYGDILPRSETARIMAMIEAWSGSSTSRWSSPLSSECSPPTTRLTGLSR